MAILVVGTLAAGFAAPWEGLSGVDNRSYVQMIQGIADHGLPYTINGDAYRFQAMQSPWNYARDERLWGTYPPLFPYLAAPFYELGGLKAVAQLNVSLMALLALGVFLLGRRLTGDPLLGTAAAYVTLFTSPSWHMGSMLASFALATTCLIWSVYLALSALDSRSDRRLWRAAGAGFLGGVASGSHLVTFSMVSAIVLALMIMRAPGDTPLRWHRLRTLRHGHWLPTRSSLARGVAAIGGAAIPLGFVAIINRIRFLSFNPISYGPCNWNTCTDNRLIEQRIGPMLEYATPVFLWGALALVAAFLARRSRRGLLLVGVAALVALLVPSILQDRFVSLVTIARGFVFHLSDMMEHDVTKALLQCAPAFALALLVRFDTSAGKRAALLIALPVVALVGSLTLRANLPEYHALGAPYPNHRYLMPAVPLLAVLAVASVRHLPWARRHFVVAGSFAVGLGLVLSLEPDPHSTLQRVVVLGGSLTLAAVALALVWRARRAAGSALRGAATIAAALAFAFGVAVMTRVDLPVLAELWQARNDDLARVGELTPQRFALMSSLQELSPLLRLQAERDMEYADLDEVRHPQEVRQLIAHWTAAGLPIYAVFPPPPIRESPWRDVRYDYVDLRSGLVRIRMLD